jgi:hypothetical protein
LRRNKFEINERTTCAVHVYAKIHDTKQTLTGEKKTTHKVLNV